MLLQHMTLNPSGWQQPRLISPFYCVCVSMTSCPWRVASVALGQPCGAEPEHSGQTRLGRGSEKGGRGGVTFCDLGLGAVRAAVLQQLRGRLPEWVKKPLWLRSLK